MVTQEKQGYVEKGEVEQRELGGLEPNPTTGKPADQLAVIKRIQNPLHGIPRDQLMRDVELFCKEKNLTEHIETFRKGALLSQDPKGFDKNDLMTPEEREHIRYEHAHKWSHPKTMYLTIFLCSLGAAVQGWDQTGSNGANLSFPSEFGIGSDSLEDAWLVGLVNSAPYISSAFLGCWLSDPLNNYFGRRGCIFITGIILIITPICSGFVQSWWELFIVRLLLGIGMGAKGSTVPVFAAENSPPLIRGALVMGWQLWTAFGIFLGNCANAAVGDVGKIAWRLQLGSAFIPAVPLVLFIYKCPESPRWLMKKNRYVQAYASLQRLRFYDVQAARDMYSIHVALEAERLVLRGETYIARFTELFTIPRVRRATVAASVVMLAQQMCGINIIAFYSSTVFVQAGYTNKQALYASLGFGAVNFVFAFPGLITIDKYGRRTLLLFGFPQMAWTLLVAGLLFLVPETVNRNTRVGVIALFIYLFTAFYSFTEGPVPFTYSAEVFPLAQREQGMAWAVTICLFFAAVLSMSYPAIQAAFTSVGAFGFYAGLNITAFVLLFLFMPETKQRTLEELDQVFSVPTRTFIRYQINETLPYWWHHYVLRKKNYTKAPLYEIDGDVDSESIEDHETGHRKAGTP